MDKKFDEKRNAERYNIENYSAVKIMLPNGENNNDATNGDISITGIQFKIEETSEIKEGAQVPVNLCFFDKLIIKFDVIIKHIGKDGIGCEFVKGSDISTTALNHFLNTLKS